jgi:hypothetical protein
MLRLLNKVITNDAHANNLLAIAVAHGLSEYERGGTFENQGGKGLIES